MTKKIKSFTVDENVSSALVKMFKKYGVKVSVSQYVNSSLTGLLNKFKELEDANKQKYNDKELMAFIIDWTVGYKAVEAQQPQNELHYPDPNFPEEYKESYEEGLFTIIDEWRVSFECGKRGISPELYQATEFSGDYLSRDKKYVLEKDTGKKKFKVIKSVDGTLGLGEYIGHEV